MNLNSILIGSEAPQTLADYYTKLFGKPGWEDGGYTGWQIGTGGMHRRTTRSGDGRNTQPGRLDTEHRERRREG